MANFQVVHAEHAEDRELIPLALGLVLRVPAKAVVEVHREANVVKPFSSIERINARVAPHDLFKPLLEGQVTEQLDGESASCP